MKKILLPILLLFSLTLAACGSASSETRTGSAPSGDSGGALPELTQLVIGTLKLDDTGYAVTAEQAAELLPLWQVYQSLSTSDTAAPEEVDALEKQIQGSMTPGQMQAIRDMKLTQQDVMAFMQEQGLAMTGPGGREMNAEQMATVEALRSSGGGGGFAPPDGGGPGAGGGFAPPDGGGGAGFPGGGEGGQSLDPDQIATLQASRAAGGAGGINRTPSVLIDALIQFLQEKAGS